MGGEKEYGPVNTMITIHKPCVSDWCSSETAL